MTGEDRYKHLIVDVCDTLHGVATGSGDGLYLHEILELKEWLEYRINNWSWGPERSAYDRLVFRMVEVVLVEVDKYFAMLAKQPLMKGYCDECGGSDCSDIECELTRRAIFLWDNAQGLYPGGTP